MRTMNTIHVGKLNNDTYNEYRVVVWREGHSVTSALVKISGKGPTMYDFLPLRNQKKTDENITRRAQEFLTACGYELVDSAT